MRSIKNSIKRNDTNAMSVDTGELTDWMFGRQIKGRRNTEEAVWTTAKPFG